MVAYVAIVAVTDILLGMVLARLINPKRPSLGDRYSDNCATGDPTDISDPRGQFEPRRNERSAEWGEPSERVNEQSTQSASSEVLQLEASGRNSKKITAAAKTWADFTHQVHDLSERLQYCRSVQDKSLAKQVAGNLKVFAQNWYSQCEPLLLGETPNVELQELVNGIDLGALEMFAAQIETSIANIDNIDYSLPFEEIIGAIEKEIVLLTAQQTKLRVPA